jgi:hypothetical protein
MKLKSVLFVGYLLAVIIYSGFVLLPEPAPATLLQYHVSVTGLRLIYITIIVLLAGIWFAGLYGYQKLQTYARLIQGENDGKQVARLTRGVLILALWLPVTSVVGAILNYFAMRHLGFLPAATIINHYVGLLFPLFGLVFIGLGARGLNELVKQRPGYLTMNILAVVLIYIGLTYLRLVATTPARASVYHMSLWWVTITLVAPYVYMWYVGLLATYEIYRYRQVAPGTVYRKSWLFLSVGIGWLLLLSIGTQYLTTLTARLNRLSIYGVLAIVYALLLLLAVGFVLIAAGARKLQKIEEV